MGKIRIKTLGDETTEEADKQKKAIKNAEKKARLSADDETLKTKDVAGDSSGRAPDSAEFVRREARLERALAGGKDEAGPAINEKTLKPKKSKFIKVKQRSAKYKTALLEIDKNKTYPLSEAIELLRKVKLSKFDETVELHVNTTQAGISGQVKLPNGSGKEIRIAIADDELLGKIEAGKIDFDILIAEPTMMAKLAKVAKILGPKGLMPNPKNGTISENPQEAMKKFQGGQVYFKTESKIPVMHLSVGKTSFDDKKLLENIETMIAAIKKDRIRKITLKSTMSPGIRLQV